MAVMSCCGVLIDLIEGFLLVSHSLEPGEYSQRYSGISGGSPEMGGIFGMHCECRYMGLNRMDVMLVRLRRPR